MDTASTWNSYKEAMVKILNTFIPRRVLEWGIGESTNTILDHEAVLTLDSVESSSEWVEKFKHLANSRFNLIYEPYLDLYPLVSGRFDKYDLIFIDGKLREECLKNCHAILESEGIVILHDAMRPQYQNEIYKFKHYIFEDGGHTAIMTNNVDVYGKLRELFNEENVRPVI